MAGPMKNLWANVATERMEFGTLTPADIVATGTNQFGDTTNGYVMLTVPAGYAATLIEVVCMYDYSTAQYGGGGNVTVRAGTTDITGNISAANSFGAAADKIVWFVPLAANGSNLTAANTFALRTAAAFTQPGTAAGVIRWAIRYRLYQTNL